MCTYKYRWFVFASLFLATNLMVGVVKPRLYEVFHHCVELQPPKALHTEVGKLILGFTQEPVFQVANSENREASHAECLFTFSGTEFHNAEVAAMAQAVASKKTAGYTVAFEALRGPEPKIICKIMFDGKKMGVTYAVADTINNHKHLIVTVYDKVKYEKKPLLTVAQNSSQQVQQILPKKRMVIIDCGHGGSDCGAIGLYDLHEKMVNLEVGRYVAALLHKEGYDVFLTRDDDVQIALDGRTRIHGGNQQASLLVSIHANAARSQYASGIETFFFDADTFCSAKTKQAKLAKAIMSERCTKSSVLAHAVHKEMLAHARTYQQDIVDRRVKQGFFQVLVGASVPSILVELGFLTNQAEAARITSKQYKILLARGICKGINVYFDGLQEA